VVENGKNMPQKFCAPGILRKKLGNVAWDKLGSSILDGSLVAW
jgi:hypothetical protein